MSLDDIIKGIVEDTVKERRDYSDLRTIAEAKRYCRKTFVGMGRSEIAHDYKKGGSGFYNFLANMGWRDIVLPKSKVIYYSFLKTMEDAKRYCMKTFPGMTVSDIQSDTKNHGSGFYAFLVKKGWAEEALPERMRPVGRDYSALKTVDDAIRYCRENFPGKGRRQIQLYLKNRGSGFYEFVSRMCWRDEVLPERLKEDYSSIKTVRDAKRYLKENYSGMTRTELYTESGGSGFYQYLGRKGWRDEVLPERKRKDYSVLKAVEDARRYYEKNFNGMKRGELASDRENGGSGFYSYLGEMGWRDEVLPESKCAGSNDYSGIKKLNDAKRYYKRNFIGMSRTQVQTDRKNGGAGFYKLLTRKGWRDLVFPPKMRHPGHADYSAIRTIDDAVRYRNDNYAGMTRNRLKHDHDNGGCGFYQYVSRRGWIDAVIPRREKG